MPNSLNNTVSNKELEALLEMEIDEGDETI